MKLEVIAKNLKDVLIINHSQADRIELCKNLKVGGLTPSRWTIWWATKLSKKPINVMLRPTSRSFNYNQKEFQKMLHQAKWIAKTKVNGVVLGILDSQNNPDQKRMAQIIQWLPQKSLTFHKAFDEILNWQEALKTLSILKIDSVLTSGGDPNEPNIQRLKSLSTPEKICVIAGGGINFQNLKSVQAVVNEIHVGRVVRQKQSWDRPIQLKLVNQLKTIMQNNEKEVKNKK